MSDSILQKILAGVKSGDIKNQNFECNESMSYDEVKDSLADFCCRTDNLIQMTKTAIEPISTESISNYPIVLEDLNLVKEGLDAIHLKLNSIRDNMSCLSKKEVENIKKRNFLVYKSNGDGTAEEYGSKLVNTIYGLNWHDISELLYDIGFFYTSIPNSTEMFKSLVEVSAYMCNRRALVALASHLLKPYKKAWANEFVDNRKNTGLSILVLVSDLNYHAASYLLADILSNPKDPKHPDDEFKESQNLEDPSYYYERAYLDLSQEQDIKNFDYDNLKDENEKLKVKISELEVNAQNFMISSNNLKEKIKTLTRQVEVANGEVFKSVRKLEELVYEFKMLY